MKLPIILSVTTFLLSFLSCVHSEQSQGPSSLDENKKGVYRAGAVIPIEEKAYTMQSIVDQSELHEREVVVSGRVGKVCQKKGCWMQIKTNAEEVMVKFKNYGFFVPLSSEGKYVRMLGQLRKKVISVADQRHYLEDAGESKEKIAQIKTPKTTFRFIASGVEISAKPI